MLKSLGRIALTGGVLALGTAIAVPAFTSPAHAVEEKMAKGLGKDIDWINAPVMDQFEQLRGRVIFIDLWGINWGPCVGGIPHVQDLHDKYKDKGLLVFAPHVQSADKDELEMFLLKRGVTYHVAVKSDTSDYPGRGIPRAAVIDVDGKIVWQGHPNGGECDKVIERELKRVDQYGAKTIVKNHKAIAMNLLKGKLGAAWTAMQKIKGKKEEGGKTVASSELDLCIERLKTEAEALLGRAKQQVEVGDYLGGEATCTEVEKKFKGSEWADKAKAFKKEIKDKSDYKDVKKAGAMWAKIKAQASEKKSVAIAIANQLANSKFKDTWYGQQAAKVARLLDGVK